MAVFCSSEPKVLLHFTFIATSVFFISNFATAAKSSFSLLLGKVKVVFSFHLGCLYFFGRCVFKEINNSSGSKCNPWDTPALYSFPCLGVFYWYWGLFCPVSHLQLSVSLWLKNGLSPPNHFSGVRSRCPLPSLFTVTEVIIILQTHCYKWFADKMWVSVGEMPDVSGSFDRRTRSQSRLLRRWHYAMRPRGVSELGILQNLPHQEAAPRPRGSIWDFLFCWYRHQLAGPTCATFTAHTSGCLVSTLSKKSKLYGIAICKIKYVPWWYCASHSGTTFVTIYA